MYEKRVTCELHESYFCSMTIKHAIPKTAEVHIPMASHGVILSGREPSYNWVHRKFNQLVKDAVEKASTQQRKPLGPRLRSLEIKRVRDKWRSRKPAPREAGPQAPGWAAQENGKETLMAIEWGSICCSSVWSPAPSHAQPFQIKWEVHFSRNCVARRRYCVVRLARAKCNKSKSTPSLLY